MEFHRYHSNQKRAHPQGEELLWDGSTRVMLWWLLVLHASVLIDSWTLPGVQGPLPVKIVVRLDLRKSSLGRFWNKFQSKLFFFWTVNQGLGTKRLTQDDLVASLYLNEKCHCTKTMLISICLIFLLENISRVIQLWIRSTFSNISYTLCFSLMS